MVRNRDFINRSITALETKFEALRRHVERGWPVEDFEKHLKDSEAALRAIQQNIHIDRNSDILAKELSRVDKSLTALRKYLNGMVPVEEYIKAIEHGEKALEALDMAVQREPVEGKEITTRRT